MNVLPSLHRPPYLCHPPPLLPKIDKVFRLLSFPFVECVKDHFSIDILTFLDASNYWCIEFVARLVASIANILNEECV